MNIKDKIYQLSKQLKGKIYFDENLSKFSWFSVGGPADYFFKPHDVNDLSIFLKEIDNKIPVKVIGLGSNLLVRDNGFKGVVIKLGKNFSNISIFKDKIIAGASAFDKSVANLAYENSISGFEFLYCIPGSIGGGIKMNSGCYDNDISKILISAQVIDKKGHLKVIPREKIKFHYRGSDLPENYIFLSATMKGNLEKKNTIKEKMDYFFKMKKQSQPSKIKTCGSTFKNPQDKNKKKVLKAWELIKKANCQTLKIGGAKISEQHCNFFINTGSATANDLEKLINKVQKKVYENSGIKLEPEIQIIGSS